MNYVKKFMEDNNIEVYEPFRIKNENGTLIEGKYYFRNDKELLREGFEINHSCTLSLLLCGTNTIVKIIKISDDEKAVLRCIPKEYKYLARDKNGSLWIFTQKPYKNGKILDWEHYVDDCANFYLFEHLFKMVKWEDEEPTLISDLLEDDLREEEK